MEPITSPATLPCQREHLKCSLLSQLYCAGGLAHGQIQLLSSAASVSRDRPSQRRPRSMLILHVVRATSCRKTCVCVRGFSGTSARWGIASVSCMYLLNSFDAYRICLDFHNCHCTIANLDMLLLAIHPVGAVHLWYKSFSRSTFQRLTGSQRTAAGFGHTVSYCFYVLPWRLAYLAPLTIRSCI